MLFSFHENENLNINENINVDEFFLTIIVNHDNSRFKKDKGLFEQQ